MDLTQYPDMLKVEEAAKALRISRTVAYEQVHLYEVTGGAEGLPVVRIGRNMRVPKFALLRWLEHGLGMPVPTYDDAA